MGLLRSANRASAPLNAAITSGATAVVLTAGKGALFPALAAGEYFFAVIQKGVLDTDVREYVKVTARATDTLTIVRAQGGSTAQAFAAGDVLAQVVTAEALDGFAMREPEVQVASAATVDLWAATKSEDIEITGTTNISSFEVSAPAGTIRRLRFTNSAPGFLIHGTGAGQIINPASENFKPQSNDVIVVRKEPGGAWRIISITPGAYFTDQWERIYTWTPTAVNVI